MADQNEQQSSNSHPEKVLQLQQQEEHQNQCDKSKVPSSLEGTTEEPKTLTNIYYDCLERIFDFLDLGSLLNVAQTCKRLQIAAIAKFSDEYGGKSITGFTHFGDDIDAREIDQHTVFQMSGLKNALPYLRCFGAKISKLCVVNNIIYNDAAKEAHLYEYINRYCANSLTYISLSGNGTFFDQKFPMQFVNVETVGIFEYNNINLPNVASCFPNTHTLAIRGDFNVDSMSIVSIPHLEYLNLINLTIENAAKLLHVNRQLPRLKLTFAEEITFDRLVNMLDGNSSISELDIVGTLTDMNEVDLNRFVIQCPDIRELKFTYSFTADLAFKMINQLRSLERFEFLMNDRSEFDRLVSRMKKARKHWRLHFNNRKVTYTNLVNRKN